MIYGSGLIIVIHLEETKMMEIINWILTHKMELLGIYLQLVGIASIIVKLTPTLKDDTILKEVIKFTAKVLALNRK